MPRSPKRAFTFALAIMTTAASITCADAPESHLIDQAMAHLQAERWGDARAAFGRIVAANPHHALPFYRLGIALSQLKRWDEAVSAFLRARELGARAFDCDYRIARAHLGAGRREAALDWIERALIDDAPANAGILDFVGGDESLAPLRGEPRFRTLVGAEEGGPGHGTIDAVTRRREDLDFLVDRLRRTHHDLYHRVDRAAFDSKVGALRARLENLDDSTFIAELARIVTSIGDGHTSLWPAPEGSSHYLPLSFYRFADGLFVRAAAPGYAALAGGRVVSIGGRSVQALFESASTYISHDNIWQLYEGAPKAFGMVELLRLFGATVDNGAVSISLEKDGAPFEAVVTSISQAEAERLLASTLEANPRFDWRLEPPSWSSMSDLGARPGPLWTRHAYRAYWFQYLEDERIIYLQYNDAREEDDLSFTAFVDRVLEAVEEHRPRALVIDLRLNSGGRTFLSQPLVKRLTGHPDLDRRGALFTIVGRRTASAAMRFAAHLDFWTETLFVGEPTGQPPNVHGGTNRFRLPHSGQRFTVSSRYWIGGRTTDDTRPWIAPDLVAEMTSADYAAQRDPAMDAVRAYLTP